MLKLYTYYIAVIGKLKIDLIAKWVRWLVNKAIVAKMAIIAVWLAYTTG